MRIVWKLLLPVTAALLLYGPVTPRLASGELADALPEAVQEYGDRDNAGLLSALGELLAKAPEQFLRECRGSLGKGALIVAVAALTSLAGPLAGGKAKEFTDFTGAAVASLLCLQGSDSLVETAVETVTQLSDWSLLTLPVLTSSAAAAGQVHTAAMGYAAAALGVSLLSRLVVGLAVPLVLSYLALAVAAACFHAPMLRKLAELMKQLAKWSLTLLSGALFAYLVLSGTAAGAADAVALKASKTALGAIPVVGGMTAEAAAAVLSGAALIRTGTGLIGLLGVLGICLAPFLRLLATVTVLRLSAALASCFTEGRIPPLLEDIGGGLSFLLGCCGLNALYLFFSLLLLLRGTGL